MSNNKHNKTLVNSPIKKGLILIAFTIWFIPGIVLQLLEVSPKNTDSFVSKLFSASYQITPKIVSIQDVIQFAVKDQPVNWLTAGNIIGLVIAAVFILGCLKISGALKQNDRLFALKRQADDEKIKDDFKK